MLNQFEFIPMEFHVYDLQRDIATRNGSARARLISGKQSFVNRASSIRKRPNFHDEKISIFCALISDGYSRSWLIWRRTIFTNICLLFRRRTNFRFGTEWVSGIHVFLDQRITVAEKKWNLVCEEDENGRRRRCLYSFGRLGCYPHPPTHPSLFFFLSNYAYGSAYWISICKCINSLVNLQTNKIFIACMSPPQVNTPDSLTQTRTIHNVIFWVKNKGCLRENLLVEGRKKSWLCIIGFKQQLH